MKKVLSWKILRSTPKVSREYSPNTIYSFKLSKLHSKNFEQDVSFQAGLIDLRLTMTPHIDRGVMNLSLVKILYLIFVTGKCQRSIHLAWLSQLLPFARIL